MPQTLEELTTKAVRTGFFLYWTSQQRQIPCAIDARTLQAIARSEIPLVVGKKTKPLRALLEDRIKTRSDTRDESYVAVEQLKELASDFLIATIVDQLNDHKESSWHRLRCARTLGRTGISFPHAMAALLAGLKDSAIRSACAEALGEISAAFSGKFSDAFPEVIEALLEGLKNEEQAVRSACARALGKIGVALSEVIAALLVGLQDEDEWVRCHCAGALGRIGVSYREIIATLLVGLNVDSVNVQSHCAEALGEISAAFSGRFYDAFPEVIEALLEGLKNEDWSVRNGCAKALGMTGDSSQKVVSALNRAVLKSRKYSNSYSIKDYALQLGRAGVHSPEAVANIVKITNRDAEVPCYCAKVLRNIGTSFLDPEVIEALIMGLKSGEKWVRLYCAETLNDIGFAPSEALTALLAGLEDEEEEVRCHYAEVLGNIGISSPDSEVAAAIIEGLKKGLEDESLSVRYRCIKALREKGVSSPEVIGMLHKGLKNERFTVRYRCIKALGRQRRIIPKGIVVYIERFLVEYAEKANFRNYCIYALKNSNIRLFGRAIYQHNISVRGLTVDELVSGLRP